MATVLVLVLVLVLWGFCWAIWTGSEKIQSRGNPKGSPSNLESEATSTINLSDEVTPNPELYKKASRVQIFFLMLAGFVAAVIGLLTLSDAPPPPGWPKYIPVETSTTTTQAPTTTTEPDGSNIKPSDQYSCWTGNYFEDGGIEERTLQVCFP